jgi:enterochelin esterase-like enzyme
MKKVLILIAFISLSLQGFAVDRDLRIMESLGMYSRILGQEVSYSVYLPKDYHTTNMEYPVVYLLHGLGDNETAWLEYGRIAQIVNKKIDAGEIVPMIFIIPQGFRSYYVNHFDGEFPYQDMFMQELIPFMEKEYRIKRGRQYRATMGYSMGGFGALILPLKHPDSFVGCVPLSISVRTDEQYKTEDPRGWDDQWGRLFGGVGTTGEARITEYYRQNSPFHIIANAKPGEFKDLKIFIDNGDDEQTLAFSNEELHILMRDKNITHEYRVRNGGHEFRYWREGFENGLRFLSDAFEGKEYRGDIKTEIPVKDQSNLLLRTISIDNKEYSLYVPAEYDESTRLYPVVYSIGHFSDKQKNTIALQTNHWIEKGEIPPVMMLFLEPGVKNLNDILIPAMENEHRARKGFRFRALLGFESGGKAALHYVMNPEQFTSCVLFDANDDFESFREKFNAVGPKPMERTWFYIDTPDKGNYYAFNGKLHMLFREKNFYHEYRVSEGKGGFEWLLSGLHEAMIFTANKIHR